VEDGVNGYKIDVSELDKIERKIAEILTDYTMYESLSKSAFEKSKNYSEESINEMISTIVWIENN
jgi:glycosyltransferase involved in cell wall biosynthesis